ncbi:MAG: hypothetical protein LC713_03630, partial [Actinobacteria bacterium]|nr:hypothetical protein [Actinomycetota bacterium]
MDALDRNADNEGDNRQQVTKAPADEPVTNKQPVFSPDGQKIAFTRSATGACNDCQGDIYTINLDGSGEQGLTTGTAVNNMQPYWAGAATVSVSDASVVEGSTGVTEARFTVSRSGSVAGAVSVGYGTADDSATAPGDYDTKSGTVSFARGETSKEVIVEVKGDSLDEPDERFFVNLSSPQDATIADGQGAGTIIDDDDPPPPPATPTASIDDVSVTEGNSGTTAATFTVSLSAPSGKPVALDFATADDSALAPGDYQPTAGTLSFATGETSKTV